MLVSPLQINNLPSYTSGEVTIDPSAAIAPGVVLKAELNSRIAIAAGVCIGMGAILHAYNGSIEVEAGATLGAGVLVVGKGKIGKNACIGSSTTLQNSAIAPEQVVAPGSLIGDPSRQNLDTVTVPTDNGTTSHVSAESETTATPAAANPIPSPDEQELVVNQTTTESIVNSRQQIVYGKNSVNQLLSTLFPHTKSLNKPLLNDSPPDDTT